MEDADVETSSDAYARRFSGGVGEWFLAVQRGRDPRPDGAAGRAARVLDVGGGHGQLAGPLADAGHVVTVAGSADACRHRVQPLVDAGRVRCPAGDLLRLPFDARAFDVALAFRLLPHVGRWRELRGRAVPRGRARRDRRLPQPAERRTPSPSSLFAAKKRVEGDTRPFAIFADADVDAAFAAAGFAVRGARAAQFAVPMAAPPRARRRGACRARSKASRARPGSPASAGLPRHRSRGPRRWLSGRRALGARPLPALASSSSASWRRSRACSGPTDGLRCLDLGSDNGVVSLLLRRRGGRWASADLAPEAVESIRALVETDVHLVDGGAPALRRRASSTGWRWWTCWSTSPTTARSPPSWPG